MLKRINRLSKKKDIEKVSKSGKVSYASLFILKFNPNNLTFSRFGLIVSNKVSKKATKRNLIKRRIREILRLALPKIRQGFDIIIIVSPKIINQQGKVLKYSEIQEALLSLLQKAKLL
jgi:ribonuclease P protein component